MKLYIYDIATKVIVATATGGTNLECERKASAYLGTDEYAGTYSPGFGTDDGLIDSSDAEEL